MRVFLWLASFVVGTYCFADDREAISLLEEAKEELIDLSWDLPFSEIEDRATSESIRSRYRDAVTSLSDAIAQITPNRDQALVILARALDELRIVGMLLPFHALTPDVCPTVIASYRNGETKILRARMLISEDSSEGNEMPENIVSASTGLSRRIPDNNAEGVAVALSISDEGTVAGFQARIQVDHGHPADLRAYLINPAGTELLLGRFTSRDQTFGVPGHLEISPAPILGGAITGLWRVRVADVTARDTGTLTDVELTLLRSWTVSAEEEVTVDTSNRISIPDNNASGKILYLPVRHSGTVAGMRLTIDFEHSHPADLRYTLIAPDGTEVALGSGEGESGRRVFGVGGVWVDALEALIGREMRGLWAVRVADEVARDTGAVNAVELALLP